MNIDSARQLVAEWLHDWTPPPMVRRQIALPDPTSLRSILAIVGPRRAGKTFLMYQMISDLLNTHSVPRDRILFIDFEDYRLINMTAEDVDLLFTAFTQLTQHPPQWLFFDEIQRLPSWSRVLRTLHNRNHFKLVVSGSNSSLLADGIASELRGRYTDTLVLPFSFPEMLALRQVDTSPAARLTAGRGAILAVLDEYLAYGGFPEVVAKTTHAEKRALIQSYFKTVFYRDILDRQNIKARTLLDAIMRHCVDTHADLFSISRFDRMLRQGGHAGSKRTIANYLHMLEDAFFLVTSQKFSRSPKNRLTHPRKTYLLDPGFTLLAAAADENKGKRLENAVAIELKRRQAPFHYYRDNQECDFIVGDSPANHQAIQVTWELTPRNAPREFTGLIAAMNALNLKEGLILTSTQTSYPAPLPDPRIQIQPIWQWLLQEKDEKKA